MGAQAIGSESILLRNIYCICMVLDASRPSQQCSLLCYLRPPNGTHSLTSEVKVSSRGNSVWRWTVGPDKHSIAVSKTTQVSIRTMTAQARKGACVEPATARENVVVQVFSEHVARNRQQKFCTVGACGVLSSGRAGRRINQRQVSSLTHWTAQRGRETLAQDILPQAHSIYHVLYPYYIDVREYY